MMAKSPVKLQRESEVVSHADGQLSFRGPDATEYYRICTLIAGMRLYLATGIQPNRLWTPGRMRDAASGLTRQQYAKSRRGLETAMADLAIRRDNLGLALPTRIEG